MPLDNDTLPKAPKRRYYRTAVTVTFLSEEPLTRCRDLHDLLRRADSGDLVAETKFGNSDVLTGAEVVKALREFGTEPEFFMLDDTGRHIDDPDGDEESGSDVGEVAHD